MIRFPRRVVAVVSSVAITLAALIMLLSGTASATTVTDEASFTTAWQNSAETQIDLASDITITCVSGEPTRNSATAIVVDGHGHTLTQTCATKRVLEQQGTGAITLTNISVTGGDGPGGGAIDTGGDVSVTGSTLTGNHASAEGGAIQANGTVTVLGSSITNNSSAGSGGAIAAQGLTTITDSTLSGNTSGNNGGAVRAYGGATLVNSTISNNTSANGGGGIDSNQGITLVYATVVDNTGGGGGNLSVSGNLTSFGSVVALPHTSTDCVAVTGVTTTGYNLDDDGTCGFGAGPGDRSNFTSALLLAALADNGGPAETRLPGAGSPLLDQIPVAACGGGQGIVTDERGVSRPQNGACDIGAVEVAATVTPSPTANPIPATPVAIAPLFTG